ncbi:MAG: HAMP domain-containing protein, partial [Pseudomonadota bacterium]
MAEKRLKEMLNGASVFVRCAILMAITTIVVAGVLSVESRRQINNLAAQSVIDEAAKTIAIDAADLEKPIRFKAAAKIEEVAEQAMASAGENGRGVVIMNAAGEVLAAAGDDGTLRSDLTAFAADALNAQATMRERGGLWIAQPVATGAEGVVIGVVARAWSADAALASAGREANFLLAFAAILFIAMTTATLWLLRRMLGRPLETLSKAVDRVARSDYETEIELTDRRDELGQIAAHLTDLVRRLSEARGAEDARRRDMEAQQAVVEHLTQALDELAKGALTHEIAIAFPEDYEALRRNYNRAAESLRAALIDVSHGASDILTNAEQVAGASDDLAQRTEAQAATLQESVAALEQLSGSVGRVADHAQAADKSVSETRETVEQNNSMMEAAVASMG